MRQYRILAPTALAVMLSLTSGRLHAQNELADPRLHDGGETQPGYGETQPGYLQAQPTDPEAQRRISAYQLPDSGGLPANGRVEFILGEQMPQGDCGPFTLGGCNYPHGRRGIGCPHPWRTGPGWCDDWTVGPHWEATLDGVILHRQNLKVGKLDAFFGAPAQRTEQFYYEAGARAYVTGRGVMGYDVQLGYVGVDRWRAYADYFLPGGIFNRDIEFRTGFHSGELNVLPEMPGNWRLILGVRYAQIAEDIYLRDVDINVENSTNVDNKLIGVQIGGRRDLWRVGEFFYLEAMMNAGVYRNRIKRFDNSGTITGGTSIIRRVEENDLAFLGEATFSAVWRFSNCVAVRGGYQAIFFDGVTKAEDAFVGPGVTTGSLFYHGLQAGIEYRR